MKKYIDIQGVEAIQYNNNANDVIAFLGGYDCSNIQIRVLTENGVKEIKETNWVIKKYYNRYDVCSDFFFFNRYQEIKKEFVVPSRTNSEHYNGILPEEGKYKWK